MSTHCSCHCLVITSLVVTSPVAVKVKLGHTQTWSTMPKESSEGEFLKKQVLITTGKGLKMYPRQTLEFLPIFTNSELLIWMLQVSNVTDHSNFDRVYLKIFTALSLCFLAN